MSDQQKEMLSAVFDGEASDFEIRRTLSELGTHDELRWKNYQLIRDVIARDIEQSDFTIDVSAAVSTAIQQEDLSPASSVSSTKSSRNEWLKPLSGFAVAASVAFVTVMTLQTNNLDNVTPSEFIAEGNVSTSQLKISSGFGLNQVSGSIDSVSLSSEISAIENQKKQDEERLMRYLQQHSQHASFNNGVGILPMARISKEEY